MCLDPRTIKRYDGHVSLHASKVFRVHKRLHIEGKTYEPPVLTNVFASVNSVLIVNGGYTRETSYHDAPRFYARIGETIAAERLLRINSICQLYGFHAFEAYGSATEFMHAFDFHDRLTICAVELLEDIYYGKY